jgi:hypothetical protein
MLTNELLCFGAIDVVLEDNLKSLGDLKGMKEVFILILLQWTWTFFEPTDLILLGDIVSL